MNPASAPRVFLARHGQTTLNAENRLRGLADPPLDAAGQLEAARMAAAFLGEGVKQIRSSPLQRARQTAAAIAASSGLELVIDPRLNDRDYGTWTGHLKTEVTAQWGSADHAPGVEPVSTVLERAWPVIEELGVAPATTVIITHDAVIRPILARIMNEPPYRDTRTGCWNELALINDHWVVRHLDRCPA